MNPSKVLPVLNRYGITFDGNIDVMYPFFPKGLVTYVFHRQVAADNSSIKPKNMTFSK
jgi:hypothetical protein